jgi:hypothetical protein
VELFEGDATGVNGRNSMSFLNGCEGRFDQRAGASIKRAFEKRFQPIPQTNSANFRKCNRASNRIPTEKVMRLGFRSVPVFLHPIGSITSGIVAIYIVLHELIKNSELMPGVES